MEIREYHPKVTLCSELPVSPGAFQTQHQLHSYMIFKTFKRKGNTLPWAGCPLDYQRLQALRFLCGKSKSRTKGWPRWGPEAIPPWVRSQKLTRDTALDTSITILRNWDSLFFLQLCLTAYGKYLNLNLIRHQKKSNHNPILHRLITLGKSVWELFLVLTSIKGSTLLKCS